MIWCWVITANNIKGTMLNYDIITHVIIIIICLVNSSTVGSAQVKEEWTLKESELPSSGTNPILWIIPPHWRTVITDGAQSYELNEYHGKFIWLAHRLLEQNVCMCIHIKKQDKWWQLVGTCRNHETWAWCNWHGIRGGCCLSAGTELFSSECLIWCYVLVLGEKQCW